MGELIQPDVTGLSQRESKVAQAGSTPAGAAGSGVAAPLEKSRPLFRVEAELGSG